MSKSALRLPDMDIRLQFLSGRDLGSLQSVRLIDATLAHSMSVAL